MSAFVRDIGGTKKRPKIYGVRIDTTNPNPETALEYTDDAVGMTPGSEEWDRLFGYYPCLFKDGQEVGKLNPNNFAEFEDGTPADITSGNAGDVMICFPRRGISFNGSGFKITDVFDNVNFTYNAFRRGNVKKDKFYIGVYQGNVASSKIRSLSNRTTNMTYISMLNAIDMAHNNGTNYEIFAFYQLQYIQALFLLKYKTRRSFNILGGGYKGINGINLTTGTMNKKGMNYGTPNAESMNKLFGIENFYGTGYQMISGMYGTPKSLYTTTDDFKNYDNYTYITDYDGSLISNNSHVKSVYLTNELCFLPTKTGGSNTTYYCNLIDWNKENRKHCLCFCDAWGATKPASRGMFQNSLCYLSPNTDNAYTVYRLMYL